MKNKLHIIEVAALLSLCFTLCLATWGQSCSAELSSSLIRLHVIAVSDEDYEQELKLKVRDSILAFATPLLEDSESHDYAYEVLLENLQDLQTAAESVSEGREVTVSLTNESYPTRYYDSFTLPSGDYSSLQVKIGEAEGQNWWCVVFPPLCTDETVATTAFASGEIKTISSGNDQYILRFRAMELWGEIKANLM